MPGFYAPAAGTAQDVNMGAAGTLKHPGDENLVIL
jgi:hypothetical protein